MMQVLMVGQKPGGALAVNAVATTFAWIRRNPAPDLQITFPLTRFAGVSTRLRANAADLLGLPVRPPPFYRIPLP